MERKKRKEGRRETWREIKYTISTDSRNFYDKDKMDMCIIIYHIGQSMINIMLKRQWIYYAINKYSPLQLYIILKHRLLLHILKF